MDKVKKWLRSMPLRRAFISLVLVMAVFVAGLSALTIFTCVKIQNKILASVTDYQITSPQQSEDEYNWIIADDEQIVPGENGQLVILSTEYQIANLNDVQRVAYYVAKAAMIIVPTLLFVLGTIFCAWMFYSVKIKRPLFLLLQSADRISQNDLDFCMEYPATDEMGELCRAMNIMREALLKSNKETWSMMEERRKLSVSIAHDLRTPITVMKGYTEYLSRNVPLGRISEKKLLNTIHNLSLATDRLEQYVNEIREVQALDILPVKPIACSLRKFFEEQKDEYFILAQRNHLHFSMNIEKIPEYQVMLDVILVHRMIDNVITNAIRFARHQIVMEATWKKNLLTIQIYDDGAGFSEEALRSAATPFFKENTENDHFGLGLSICNTLCHKLGGELQLSNVGGACVHMKISAEKI